MRQPAGTPSYIVCKKEQAMSNFIEMCRHGTAVPEDFDSFVEKWHQGSSTLPLHEYLGMTIEEYAAVLTGIDVCESIRKLTAADIEKECF